MKHEWECEGDIKKCKNCLMSELWDENEGKWIWLSTQEFLDCEIVCEEDKKIKSYYDKYPWFREYISKEKTKKSFPFEIQERLED